MVGTYSKIVSVNLNYNDDYSSNYTTTSIPDVNWVTGQIFSATSSLTFSSTDAVPLPGTDVGKPLTGTIEYLPSIPGSTVLHSTESFFIGSSTNSDISSGLTKAYTSYNASRVNANLSAIIETEPYEVFTFGSHFGTFQIGETVQGQSSGVTAIVVSRTNHSLTVDSVNGTFLQGEQILGLSSSAHINVSGHSYGGLYAGLGVNGVAANVIAQETNPNSPNPYLYSQLVVLPGNIYIISQDNFGHYGIQAALTNSVITQIGTDDGQLFFTITPTYSLIQSTNLGFPGHQYDIDYSANYTIRSLPDVGWVQNAIAAAVPSGSPNALAIYDGSGFLTSSTEYTVNSLTILASRPRIEANEGSYLEINQSNIGDAVLSGVGRSIITSGGNSLFVESVGVHNQFSYNVNDATFFSGIIGDTNKFIINHSGVNSGKNMLGVGVNPIYPFHLETGFGDKTYFFTDGGINAGWVIDAPTYPHLEFYEGGTHKSHFQSFSGTLGLWLTTAFTTRNNTTNFDLFYIDVSGSYYWRNGTGGNELFMYLTNTGLLGINTNSPLERLHVDGNEFITGAVYLNNRTNGGGTYVGSDPGTYWAPGDINTLVISNGAGSIVHYVNGNTNDASHFFRGVRDGQGTVLNYMQIHNSGSVQIGHMYNDGFNNKSLLDVISPSAFATSQRFTVGYWNGSQYDTQIYMNIDPVSTLGGGSVHIHGITYLYSSTANQSFIDVNSYNNAVGLGWIWDNPSGTEYLYSLIDSGSSRRYLSVHQNTGDVFIGSNNGSILPQAKLDVVSTNTGTTLRSVGVDSTVSNSAGLFLNSNSTNLLNIRNDGTIDIGDNSGNPLYRFSSYGLLTLSAITPTYGGQINLNRQDGTQVTNIQAFNLGTLFDSGDLFFRTIGGVTQMFKEGSTGNISIGNNYTSPVAKLDVVSSDSTTTIRAVGGDSLSTSASLIAKNQSTYNIVAWNDGNTTIGSATHGPAILSVFSPDDLVTSKGIYWQNNSNTREFYINNDGTAILQGRMEILWANTQDFSAFRVSGTASQLFNIDSGGTVTVNNLSGSGNRPVLANSSGDLIVGNSTNFSTTFTPGTVNVANTITHNLGTTNIIVQLWDVTTGNVIYAQIGNALTNTVDITFSVNPAGDVKIIVLS